VFTALKAVLSQISAKLETWSIAVTNKAGYLSAMK